MSNLSPGTSQLQLDGAEYEGYMEAPEQRDLKQERLEAEEQAEAEELMQQPRDRQKGDEK